MPPRRDGKPRALPLQRVFAPVLGKPCWNVKRGYGSFLTLEFGAPHLVVREPKEASATASLRVRRHLARRGVYVAGEWHLWLYCCAWQVVECEKVVGDSTSNRRIERAAACLNGQKLVSVSVASRGVRTIFQFDLGACLKTAPYDRTSEQWFLYEPSGSVFVVKAGRRYSHADANIPVHASQWQKF